jgi:hypothetical protein
MARIAQPEGRKGSLRWIQRSVDEKWPSVERPILDRTGAREIEWKSPLKADHYAEYRDAHFLDCLGLNDLTPALQQFWPQRGPQWDALAVTDLGHVLLIEAKAHIGEMCSPGTMASANSRQIIAERLTGCANKLGVKASASLWPDHFYQLANRLAHLDFLRSNGVPAFLVLVNFLNDADMDGPSSAEVWGAAYRVAFHVLGLPRRHALSPYVIEVFPDVGLPSSTI